MYNFQEIIGGDFILEAVKLYNYIGPVGILLIGLSALSLTLIIAKIFILIFSKQGKSQGYENALLVMREHEIGAVQERIKNDPHPVSKMMLQALELMQKGWSLDEIEAEIKKLSTLHFTKLSKFNRTLELIGLIAPLLGLLGTILGMISAFQALQISGSQADPAVLAGGIWEALLTTALGLCVAIPAIIAFNMFEAKLEKSKLQTYSAMERFFIKLEQYAKKA